MPQVPCVLSVESSRFGGTAVAAAAAVCDVLRHRGARIGPVVAPSPTHRAAFVVTIRKLGSSWSVGFAYEAPIGVVRWRDWVSVNDLSETASAVEARNPAPPHLANFVDRPSVARPAEPFVDRSHDVGLTVDGWIGGGSGAVVDGSSEGGIAMGATVLFQYKLLDAGLAASGGESILGVSMGTVGALIGVRSDPVPWVRAELLAVGGAEAVDGVGNSVFRETIRGGHATLPYLGGRLGFSFLPGRSHTFVLGWWYEWLSTIGRVTVYPTVSSCLGCSVGTETHSVGGAGYTTGLRLGAFFH